MNQIDQVIREYDNDNIIKKAICEVLSKNMTRELALDSLASDLQKRLYDFIYEDEDLSIDDGSNVQTDFTKEIRRILSEYFMTCE